MRQLILVKHSLPEIDPAVPAAEWRLGAEGRDRCHRLADLLARYRPGTIVASVEPKARETGELVAGRLRIPFSTAAGLHEHDRSNVGFLPAGAFDASMERFFAQPSRLVFGRETAAQARARFAATIERALQNHPTRNLVVVAHGTVISLYVAALTGAQSVAHWRRLGLPSYVVLSLPEATLLTTVAKIDRGEPIEEPRGGGERDEGDERHS